MSIATYLLGLWRGAINNLGLKLASLVLAVAAFYLVQGEQDAQRSIFVMWLR